MDTELLTNFDLEYYAGLFKIPLHDVLSKDLFNTIKPKVGGYIINLEDSDLGGSHWTCLILTKYRNLAIYYDSFGKPMPQDIIRFIKRFNKKCNIIYNIDQIQDIDSIYCGYFCLYFLYFFLVKHKKCKHHRYLLNKHNSIFDLENKKSNDNKLKILIKSIIK
jgi:hypothetical protein